MKGGDRVTLSQLEASVWQGAAPAGLAPGAGRAAHVSAHGWVPVVTPLPQGCAAAASGVGLAAAPRGHLPGLSPQREDRRQLQRRRIRGRSGGRGANTLNLLSCPPTLAQAIPRSCPAVSSNTGTRGQERMPGRSSCRRGLQKPLGVSSCQANNP